MNREREKIGLKELEKLHPESTKPRDIAKKVTENPENYADDLVWICSNYLMALGMIDIMKATNEVREIVHVESLHDK